MEERDLLRSILEPHGYEVNTATAISQVLSLITDLVPDMIVFSFQKGKTPGMDLLVRIRAIPELRRIPLVLISNTDLSEGDRQEAVSCGASKVLLHPLDLQRLLNEIEVILKNQEVL